MVGFGEPVVDGIFLVHAIEDMAGGVLIALAVDELDAVIGQHVADMP